MSSEVRQDDFSLLSDEHAAIVYKTVPERIFPRGGFQVRALRIIGYSCPEWTFIACSQVIRFRCSGWAQSV